jgi:hypothetical protein
MRSLTFFALAVAMAAAGCTSQPDLRRDSDPAVDLVAYKSFGFFEPPGAGAAPYTGLLANRLELATRRQLEAHYAYAERDPDLRVHLYLSIVERQELRSTPTARLMGFHEWGGNVETIAYRKGTLRIDLVDARKNRLVWRGVAEGRLDAKALENPGPLVEETVRQIFAGFPAIAKEMTDGQAHR